MEKNIRKQLLFRYAGILFVSALVLLVIVGISQDKFEKSVESYGVQDKIEVIY